VNANPARTQRDRIRLLLEQTVWDADGRGDFPLRRLASDGASPTRSSNDF
jgi:hypothetical protein